MATIDKQVTCVLCCRKFLNLDGLSCGRTASMASSTTYSQSTSLDRVCLCQACQTTPKTSTSAEVLSLLPDLKSNLTLSLGDSEDLVVKSRQLSLSDECEFNRNAVSSSPSETAADTCEDETSASEVAELAGYLEDQLYLPRESVSADAALMADLMYTWILKRYLTHWLLCSQ